MDSFRKLIFSFIAIAVVLVGAYFIFQDNRVFDIIFPQTELGNSAKLAVEGVRDRVINLSKPIVDPVVNGITELVDKIFNSAKQDAFKSVKDVVNKKLDGVGKSLGVKETTPPKELLIPDEKVSQGESPLLFSIKKDQPQIFVIKNPTEIVGRVEFAIDWGDKKLDEGNIDEGKTKSVYHVWTKEGEYQVVLSIKNSGVSKKYFFNIVVY